MSVIIIFRGRFQNVGQFVADILVLDSVSNRVFDSIDLANSETIRLILTNEQFQDILSRLTVAQQSESHTNSNGNIANCISRFDESDVMFEGSLVP